MKIDIPIKKRSKEEMKAYIDGFNAGVDMCIKAIQTNAERFLELVVVNSVRGEE